MATQTLRPNGTVSSGLTVVGDGDSDGTAGPLHANLNDDSDATYATVASEDVQSALVNLDTYTLAAGERVKRIRLRHRSATATSGSGSSVRTGYALSTGAQANMDSFNLSSTTVATRTGAWRDELIQETSQQSIIDGLRGNIELNAASGSGTTPQPRIHELYVDLDVWARVDAPTVTSDPSGTITDTDIPTIQSYTTALNDGTPSLYSRQVRVFRDAVYLAGGFDPETETDVEWEQTDTSLGSISTASGSPDELTVGEPLANSDTYRAYVRYGKNDVAGQTLWSTWSNVEFTLNLTLPTSPTLAVEVDQDDGRQTLTVTTAALAHDTLESIRVERSDDGGTTWAAIRDGHITTDPDDGSALAGSTAYTFHDYDAPRDTELIYRARVVEGITASGTTLTSAWTTATSVAHPNDGAWWIYDVDQWTAVLSGARVVEGPEIEVVADVGVFHPLGRDGAAVVVSGTVHGDDGTYELRATGTDECDAVSAIARYAGTLLVKSPFGDQKYVRWVQRTRRLLGTPDQPRHLWALTYAEVDDDIGTDG